jgi:ribosome-binding factor A
MKKTRRTSQLGDMIRNDLAGILQREMRDPDLAFVTVTDVEVAPDLRFARVFVSILGGPEAEEKAMAALKKAKTRVRYLLAQRAALRCTPQLDFRLDQTAAHADRIEQLLNEVSPKNEESNGDDESDES